MGLEQGLVGQRVVPMHGRVGFHTPPAESCLPRPECWYHSQGRCRFEHTCWYHHSDRTRGIASHASDMYAKSTVPAAQHFSIASNESTASSSDVEPMLPMQLVPKQILLYSKKPFVHFFLLLYGIFSCAVIKCIFLLLRPCVASIESVGYIQDHASDGLT